MNLLNILSINDPSSTAIVFPQGIRDMILTAYEGKNHAVSPVQGINGWFICADILTETDGIYGHEIENILMQNLNLLLVMPIDQVVVEEVFS